MNILVTGVAGQLGYDVVCELNKRGFQSGFQTIPPSLRSTPCALRIKSDYVLGTDRTDFDITDFVATEQFVKKVMPDAVIHCAAYTAVDAAEDNVELCRKVNVDGTTNIAKACKAVGAKMLYISTDYVFGDNPTVSDTSSDLIAHPSSVIRHPSSVKFHEVDDCTCPLNVYGQSKLDGELAVKSILDKYYIVRTSWVFGHHGKNFVETMLKLGKERKELNVVNDQIGSPTFTEDLAVLLADMIVTDKYGSYHVTNEGTCSWAEFATEIMKVARLSCKINPILSSEYPTKVVRPLNSRLSKKCLNDKGFKRLPEWKEALKRYIKKCFWEVKSLSK